MHAVPRVYAKRNPVLFLFKMFKEKNEIEGLTPHSQTVFEINYDLFNLSE